MPDQQREGSSRHQHWERGRGCARPPRQVPADKGDVHGVGTGCNLRQRVELGKLGARHQVVHLDHIAVDVRQNCRGTADRYEPEGQGM